MLFVCFRPTADYIYHMLSAAQCGALYYIAVSVPAALDAPQDMLTYYLAMEELFRGDDAPGNAAKHQRLYSSAFRFPVTPQSHVEFYNRYRPFREEAIAVFSVLRSGWQEYESRFLAPNEALCCSVCNALENLPGFFTLPSAWAKASGITMQLCFTALLCAAMENGPQAIDVSPEKDVFFAGTKPERLAALISHEYGIYLLRKAMPDVLTGSMEEYPYLEALAEYYNRRAFPGYPCSGFHEGLISACDLPALTPKERYLRLREQRVALNH